jgi:hypothetical protein
MNAFLWTLVLFCLSVQLAMILQWRSSSRSDEEEVGRPKRNGESSRHLTHYRSSRSQRRSIKAATAASTRSSNIRHRVRVSFRHHLVTVGDDAGTATTNATTAWTPPSLTLPEMTTTTTRQRETYIQQQWTLKLVDAPTNDTTTIEKDKKEAS